MRFVTEMTFATHLHSKAFQMRMLEDPESLHKDFIFTNSKVFNQFLVACYLFIAFAENYFLEHH